MADVSHRIMTLDDLASYVKLSKSSLYKLCQAGKVLGTKVGRHWRFHHDAIDAWIRDGVWCQYPALAQVPQRQAVCRGGLGRF